MHLFIKSDIKKESLTEKRAFFRPCAGFGGSIKTKINYYLERGNLCSYEQRLCSQLNKKEKGASNELPFRHSKQ